MTCDWSDLERLAVETERRAELGIAVLAPDGGRWSRNGERQFPAASTVKIPVMVEIFRRIDRGALALDDLHRLDRAEKTPGTGVLLHMHAGLALSVADLLSLTMSVSDNTAANILIELAGLPAINATMAELGMAGSVLGRKMRGFTPIPGEGPNLATADDYVGLLQAILDGRAASPASCAAMLALLESQQNRRCIGRHVPAAAGWRWGSKSGNNVGELNDVGFVAGPGGTMLIAVYCRGIADEREGEAAVAGLALAAMRATGLI